jgi:transposase
MKQKKKRRSYSLSFKKEAAKFIIEKGYNITEASRQLGIEYSVLRRWKKQFENAISNQVTTSPVGIETDNILRLEDELKKVTRERDMLKKALAAFIENGKEN